MHRICNSLQLTTVVGAPGLTPARKTVAGDTGVFRWLRDERRTATTGCDGHDVNINTLPLCLPRSNRHRRLTSAAYIFVSSAPSG